MKQRFLISCPGSSSFFFNLVVCNIIVILEYTEYLDADCMNPLKNSCTFEKLGEGQVPLEEGGVTKRSCNLANKKQTNQGDNLIYTL